MTAVAGNYFTLAIGRQTAKGVPQTTPQYKLKLTSGDIEPNRDIFQLSETDASRQQGSSVVVSAKVEGSPEFYVRPDDFGLLSYGLLGANADAGTAPNYIHTATMLNSGALPYFTIYKAIGGSVIVDRYLDCRITGMKLKGQAGQPLTCQIDLQGLAAAFGQSDPVLSPVTQDPLVYPQLVVSKGGSAPGTVESFELDIDNANQLFQGDGSIFPYDTIPGKLGVSGTFTILFETDVDYRKFHTGTGTGTAMTTTLFQESLAFVATANANLSIAAELANAAYTAYPVPPDPGGAPIRVAAGFNSQRDAATIANYIKLTSRNQVASY